MALDTEIWPTPLMVLLCHRVLLYGEIKRYKSPIRIERITIRIQDKRDVAEFWTRKFPILSHTIESSQN